MFREENSLHHVLVGQVFFVTRLLSCCYFDCQNYANVAVVFSSFSNHNLLHSMFAEIIDFSKKCENCCREDEWHHRMHVDWFSVGNCTRMVLRQSLFVGVHPRSVMSRQKNKVCVCVCVSMKERGLSFKKIRMRT